MPTFRVTVVPFHQGTHKKFHKRHEKVYRIEAGNCFHAYDIQMARMLRGRYPWHNFKRRIAMRILSVVPAKEKSQ